MTCSFLGCPNRPDFTADQRRLNDLYSGVSVAYLAALLAWMFLWSPLSAAYKAMFPSDDDHVGDASDLAFRQVGYEISPTVTLELLHCDSDLREPALHSPRQQIRARGRGAGR